MSTIDQLYKKMDASRGIAKQKGDTGEEILRQVLLSYQRVRECIIVHSYKYPYASNRQGRIYPGNIKREGKAFIEVTRGGIEDEIDLILITTYRIFLIEAKARSGTWKVYDDWCSQNSVEVDKSPVTQSEKHARHFYHTLYEYIPDGNPNYVVPMAVFVDHAKIVDSRDDDMRQYLLVTIANKLRTLIREHDTPLKYEIDIEKLMTAMQRKGNGRFYK